jgi:hypothetical protein
MSTHAIRGTTLGALALTLLISPPWAAAQADTGSANFGRFVALGDSLTAGFSSGGLVETLQRTSYPALIARQAGVGDAFAQPLVSEPGIPPLLELRSLAPLVIAPRPGVGAPLNLGLPRPYNNLAVPGARTSDVLHRVTHPTNVLYDVILRGIGTQVQQAASFPPTFAVVWAGNNDVLGAAVSGIVIDGVTLTRRAVFEGDYRAIVGTLAAVGAQLALATLPDVTAIPYVTTVPPVVINPATGEPVLIGGEPVFLIGPAGPLTFADRVLLPAAALLAQGIGIPAQLGGSGQPLPDDVVLDAAEIAAIVARTNELNAVIRAVAQERGAALVDIHAIFREIAAHGHRVGGIELRADFLTGGIFSYDGVHPTAFGYALVANAFIDTINAQFGARIPPVDYFPILFGPAQGAGAPAWVVPATALLSAGAERELWRLLDLPSREQLRRMKERIQPESPERERPEPGRDLSGSVAPVRQR